MKDGPRDTGHSRHGSLSGLLMFRRAVEVALEQPAPHPVNPKEMMAVLNLMSSSPVAMFVRSCSLEQKVMMAAVVRCVRREGVAEIAWRSVSIMFSGNANTLDRQVAYRASDSAGSDEIYADPRSDPITMPSPAHSSNPMTSSPPQSSS